MDNTKKYDYYVAIITVTATEEAGLRHMYNDWKPLFLEGDDQKYYETTFDRGGKTFKIVTARQSEMGMTAAGVLTMKMISLFKPKHYAIVLCVAALGNFDGYISKYVLTYVTVITDTVIVSSLGIISTTIVSRIFREKFGVRGIISIVFAFAATFLLFMFG